jgi:cytoskeletal protein RodZ
MAAGGIVLAVIMLLVIPVLIMFGGAIWSALFGWLLVEDREQAPNAANPTTSE